MSVELHSVPAVAAPRRRSAPKWQASLRTMIRRGLLDRRRAILVWGLSLGSLSAFMAAIYPSIRDSIDQIAKNYPGGLKEAFGVQAMNTVEGYIHAEMFSLIVPLAMGYFAIRAVSGAIVGAEERGYLDTILSLPVSRTVLIAGSYLVAAVACLMIMALTGAMTFIVRSHRRHRYLAGTCHGRRAGRVAAGHVLRRGGGARFRRVAQRAGSDWAGGWPAGRDVCARRRRPARQRLGSDPLDIGVPLLRRTNA